MNTFEITIQRASDGNWPIVVRHQSGPIALTSWAQGTFELNLKRLDLLLPTDRQYGKLLGEHIFRAEVRDAFVRAVSSAKASSESLRVWLIVEAENLRSLHWEQLCAPYGTGRWDYLLLNQQTPFSLYLPSQIERRFPPIGRRDLRALLLVAGPEELEGDYGLATFDVPATIAALTASLGEIPHDVLANSGEGNAGEPSLRALTNLLTDRHYTLLFIVSHGAYRAEDGETILYFPEDERHRPVTGSQLIERLSRIDGPYGLPHFTFLSTCESADPQAENGLGGLGQRLVRELGMPAVLAMTDRVSIQTAQDLTKSLCARLSEHGEVDRALVEALTTIKANYDLTVPALFSRLGGRPLFSDALDRPLTATEIRYGLEQLSNRLKERAPVLIDEFLSYRTKIQSTLDIDPDALSQETHREREAALAEINQLSNRALDISFNGLALGHKAPEYDPRPPFRGLYPFRAEDREFFFGRRALVGDLIARLDKHNFLAVLGPSGCGKSSLVLAGLVPGLGPPMAYMTPGDDPVANLENALAGAEPGSLLVVDQFEELFTLCRDQTQRETFLGMLLKTTGEMPVVITMRADFLGECAAYPGLRSAIEAHQALIGPMSGAELRRAMERQADHVGLRFQAGLGEQILDDVQGEPGAMPLLQHALLLLWQRRHGRWLRWDEYTAIGGIREAIAHTTEEVYSGLSEAEKRRVRNIFIRLTRPPEVDRSQEGTRYTRRRVNLVELVPAGSDPGNTILLVNRLADARLVVTRQREDTGEVEVEVAHEALIQHWPRLRNWLDESRANILLREALTQAARDWESLDRDPGALYRGARLAQAQEWVENQPTDLNILEQEFLTASQVLAQREEAARERQRKLILISTFTISIVMTILGLIAVNGWQRARYQTALAQTEEARAIEAERIANAQRLGAQGQFEFENNPLLGLKLVLEGVVLLNSTHENYAETIIDSGTVIFKDTSPREIQPLLIPFQQSLAPFPDNPESRYSLEGTLREMAKHGRLHSMGRKIAQMYLTDGVRLEKFGNAEMSFEGSDVVFQFSGSVVKAVRFIPDSLFLLVVNREAPSELRHKDNGKVVPLAGIVDLDRTFHIQDSSFLVLRYVDAPGELRRGDNGEVVLISDDVFDVYPIPDSQLYVVAYADGPGELRRMDNDKIVPFSEEVTVEHVKSIPDSPFSIKKHADGTSELLDAESTPLLDMGLGVDGYFMISGNRMVVWYTDRRAYLLDLDWLQSMRGLADKMPINELLEKLCEGPLALGLVDESVLQEYLGELEPQACN